MSYTARIATLTESLRRIDGQIAEASEAAKPALQELRTQYSDEIRRLQRLQWEYETQTVHFDDDR